MEPLLYCLLALLLFFLYYLLPFLPLLIYRFFFLLFKYHCYLCHLNRPPYGFCAFLIYDFICKGKNPCQNKKLLLPVLEF